MRIVPFYHGSVGLLVVMASMLAPDDARLACHPAISQSIWLGVERRTGHALIADATLRVASPSTLYLEYGN